MASLLWKVGGEAGFGVMTTGLDFAKIASKLGYYIADYAEYPSLIRGGHNTYEVHFSDSKIRSSKKPIDMLVCLNKDTYTLHKKRLHKDSIVLYDKTMFDIRNALCKTYHIPLKQTLQDMNLSIFMMNTVAMGASMAVLGWPLKTFFKIIEHTFSRKGNKVVQMNKDVAQVGHDYIQNSYSKHDFKLMQKHIPKVRPSEKQLVMTGNEAFALGSVIGDCHMYVAYPMTPASTVLTYMAKWAEETGMIVRHAEDEISVVNTAIGASFAGVRAACGTSGGGFALMAESISLAGITEIPLVMFLAQRPGPATGLPTWTEQGDLLFAVNAGHGEFPKIVLAPGDIEEMYTLAAEAYNLADIYQTPVIVLSDKHLSESHWSTPEMALTLFTKTYKVDRGKIVDKASKKSYNRYKVTSDGVSRMLIPGQKGIYYQANSYEHSEDGHSSETAKDRLAQAGKRMEKAKTYLNNHFQRPKIYGSISSADAVFVSWGSSKGVLLDAIDLLKKKGKKIAMIHFTHVYPLDEKKLKPLFNKDTRYVLVENNGTGQFGKLLRQETGLSFEHQLLKNDGRQIFIEDVIDYMKKLL